MVVVKVLRDCHTHQEIKDLDLGRVLPHPLEEMVSLVPLAAPDRHQEGRFRRLEPADILRGKLQQLVGSHRRMVDVLVGQRHVLQYRDKPLFALEALDQLRHGIETGQGVQRAAVMTRRHLGRAGHRQRGGRQHGLR